MFFPVVVSGNFPQKHSKFYSKRRTRNFACPDFGTVFYSKNCRQINLVTSYELYVRDDMPGFQFFGFCSRKRGRLSASSSGDNSAAIPSASQQLTAKKHASDNHRYGQKNGEEDESVNSGRIYGINQISSKNSKNAKHA